MSCKSTGFITTIIFISKNCINVTIFYVTLPLALHGVVVKKDGTKVVINIGEAETDPVFGRARVLFRRQSNLVRVTIFNGGHTILAAAGLDWLARQSRDKKVDWSVRKNKKAAKAAEIHK